MTADLWLLAALVVVGFAVEAAAGFGGMVIALAMGALWLPVPTLLAVLVPVNLVLSLCLMFLGVRQIATGLLVRQVLPWMAVGLALGTALSALGGTVWLKPAFAIFVLWVAAHQLRELRAVEALTPLSARTTAAWLLGGGIAHGLFATGGPPTVYVASRALPDKAVFRATLSAVWVVLNALVLARLWFDGSLDAQSVRTSAILLVPLGVGLWLGERLHRTLEPRAFRTLVGRLLLASGAVLLLTSVSELSSRHGLSLAVPLQVLGCLATPAVVAWASKRSALVEKLGPVVICYAVGILAGNVPGLTLNREVSIQVSSAAVPLAIPLLLFSADVVAWRKLAGTLLLCFALACVSAMAAAAAVGWVFRANTAEWWKIAGMLVGVYVGGTANMSAIGLALGTAQETFVLLNAADVVAGGLYLLFLVSVAQRVVGRWLRPSPTSAGVEVSTPVAAAAARPIHLTQAVVLSALLVGVGAGASLLLYGRLEPPAVLVTITSLGIAASFVPRIRSLPGTSEAGEYALLCFCVAVGSLADARLLFGHSPTLMLFVFAVMTLAIVLHVALSALFRLDTDTVLITSTATIFGPAFIGPVATALKNRKLLGPGLTLGLMGIALGTYLGLFTSWVLRTWASGP